MIVTSKASRYAVLPRYVLRYLNTKWGLRILSLILFAVLWEISGRYDRTLLFPPLSKVIQAFFNQLINGELFKSFAVSLQAFVVGLLLAIIIGVILGFLMGQINTIERFINPYVYILLSSPSIAFIPLFVVWLGLGLSSRVGIIFIFSVPIIIVNTYTGVRTVPPQLIEMGKSFGLNQNQLFLKIILPSSLPLVMSGIRLGVGQAFVGMVAADVLLVTIGIGGLIEFYNVTFRTPYLFSTVLAVIILAVVLIEITRTIEKRLTSWR